MSIRPCLIGIAGPSCSGKGELSSWLAAELAAPILPLDAYYRPLDHLTPELRAAVNFDEPEALDAELLAAQLESLAQGEPIDRPEYDFTRHTRTARTTRILPAPFVLVEGLFTLYWETVRRQLAFSVFLSAPDQVCLERRVRRDQIERGRSVASVLAQYAQTVSPMRHLHIDPTRAFARLQLDGTCPVEENGRRVIEALEANGHAGLSKAMAAVV